MPEEVIRAMELIEKLAEYQLIAKVEELEVNKNQEV